MSMLAASTAIATAGVASAVLTHGVSQKSHLLRYYPVEDRSGIVNLVVFSAMWLCLAASVVWLWLNQSWWVALLLTIFGLLASNFLMVLLPKEKTRGLPLGRPALLVSSLLAIGCALDIYFFTYWA
jgi:hypothetical protein